MRQQYRKDLDKANSLIAAFAPPTDEIDVGVGHPDYVASRVRRFIFQKYERSLPNRPPEYSTLGRAFPVLQGLSPQLRQLSSLHIMRRYLDMVPYLSSRFLSPEGEQK